MSNNLRIGRATAEGFRQLPSASCRYAVPRKSSSLLFGRTGLSVHVLLLFALAPAWSATTTVAQQITAPDGTLANGVALIRITAPCKSGSTYVGDKTIRVPFSAGAFSVSLVPNDSCIPAGTSYSVSWLLTGGTTRTEAWLVPTSGSPVTVDSVKISIPPTPAVMFQPSQVSAAGLTSGTYCISVVNGVVTGLSACSGSPGTLTWSGLSNSGWTGMTNSQWTGLGN